MGKKQRHTKYIMGKEMEGRDGRKEGKLLLIF